jgi:hypothetical protein
MAGDFFHLRLPSDRDGVAPSRRARDPNMRSKSASPMTSRQSIAGLKEQLQAALAEGVDKDSMVLRLTARDDSALKRHPDIAIEDIDFRNGEMHFLGVRVVKGETSLLDRAPA